MSRTPDKHVVDDAVWQKAVSREAVIRPLASKGRLSPADVGLACRQLEVGRARLYELLCQHRTRARGTRSVLLMNDTAASSLKFVDLGVVDLILGRNAGIADKTAQWGRGGGLIGR